MDLFKRHQFSTVFLALHFAVYLFLIYWFASGSSAYPNSCGAANGALILLALLVSAVCSVTLIAYILSNKGQKRKDYKKFLLLILLPPYIMIMVFIFSISEIN